MQLESLLNLYFHAYLQVPLNWCICLPLTICNMFSKKWFCYAYLSMFDRNLCMFFPLIFHHTKIMHEIKKTLNVCLIWEMCHYLSAILPCTSFLSYSRNIYKINNNYYMTNKILYCMNGSMLVIIELYIVQCI